MVNYFKLLGVNYHDDANKIKSAFRKMIKTLHPDTGNYNQALFTLVMEAYEILCNQEKRNKYFHKLKKELEEISKKGYYKLHMNRIVFPNRLDVILKKIRIFDKKRFHEVSHDFQEDLLVFINKREAEKGVYFYVNLPIRRVCPQCLGNKTNCCLCEGLGLITLSYPFKVELSPPIEKRQLFHIKVDQKPFRLAYYLIKKLKIRTEVFQAKVENKKLKVKS